MSRSHSFKWVEEKKWSLSGRECQGDADSIASEPETGSCFIEKIALNIESIAETVNIYGDLWKQTKEFAVRSKFNVSVFSSKHMLLVSEDYSILLTFPAGRRTLYVQCRQCFYFYSCSLGFFSFLYSTLETNKV